MAEKIRRSLRNQALKTVQKQGKQLEYTRSGGEKAVSRGVSLSPSTWRLLKLVSRKREDENNPRYAVSMIIADLLAEKELEFQEELATIEN